MLRETLLSVVYLCVCVCVESRGDIRVLVSRVALRAVDEPLDGDVSASVDYYYVEGDVVDVWCVRRWTNCTLKLDYYFGDEAIGGNGSVAESGATPARGGSSGGAGAGAGALGVRVTLRAAHNGTRVLCACARGRHTSALNLTLLSHNSYDGILNMKANGVPLRYHQSTNMNSSLYRVLYAYTRNEHVRFECDTNVKGVLLKKYERRLSHWRDEITTDTKMAVTVRPNDVAQLQYVAHNQAGILRTTFVNFLPINLRDDTPLSVNTTNSLLEVYRLNGDQLIYYYYEDGECLVMNCETSDGLVLNYNYSLVFGDTVERHKDNIIKGMRLSSVDDNTAVNCSLLNSHGNASVRHIRVLFRLRAPAAGLTDSDVLIGGAAVGAALLVGAAALAALCCRCARARTAAPARAGDHGRDSPRARTDKLEMKDTSVQRRPLPSAPCEPERTSCHEGYDYVRGNDYCAIPVPTPAPPPRTQSADDHVIYQNNSEYTHKHKR